MLLLVSAVERGRKISTIGANYWLIKNFNFISNHKGTFILDSILLIRF